MKKLVAYMLLALFALAVGACAPKNVHVKCPACQYEFDAPVE